MSIRFIPGRDEIIPRKLSLLHDIHLGCYRPTDIETHRAHKAYRNQAHHFYGDSLHWQSPKKWHTPTKNKCVFIKRALIPFRSHFSNCVIETKPNSIGNLCSIPHPPWGGPGNALGVCDLICACLRRYGSRVSNEGKFIEIYSGLREASKREFWILSEVGSSPGWMGTETWCLCCVGFFCSPCSAGKSKAAQRLRNRREKPQASIGNFHCQIVRTKQQHRSTATAIGNLIMYISLLSPSVVADKYLWADNAVIFCSFWNHNWVWGNWIMDGDMLWKRQSYGVSPKMCKIKAAVYLMIFLFFF